MLMCYPFRKKNADHAIFKVHFLGVYKGTKVIYSLIQLEGGGVASGGLRELIPCIARTSVAVGVDGIFMEVYKINVFILLFSLLLGVLMLHRYLWDEEKWFPLQKAAIQTSTIVYCHHICLVVGRWTSSLMVKHCNSHTCVVGIFNLFLCAFSL